MKPTLRLKFLLWLQEKVSKVPEGKKIPLWIRSVIFFIRLSKRISRFFVRISHTSNKFLQFFVNLYFVFLTQRSEARVFKGAWYRYFAVKYADKRSRISRVNKLCGGKRHYVIDFDDQSLLVINRNEVNRLKTRHKISKSYNVLDVFTNAYYITK
jgi:hypothetical protein